MTYRARRRNESGCRRGGVDSDGGVNRRSQNTGRRQGKGKSSERDGAINRAIGLWISQWRRSIMSELQSE